MAEAAVGEGLDPECLMMMGEVFVRLVLALLI